MMLETMLMLVLVAELKKYLQHRKFRLSLRALQNFSMSTSNVERNFSSNGFILSYFVAITKMGLQLASV